MAAFENTVLIAVALLPVVVWLSPGRILQLPREVLKVAYRAVLNVTLGGVIAPFSM
jgi:hypothetical protein